jgi:3'-phosphoadenosine 5'-phosphosulfate (PAPS) 3'-phosphatase
MLRLMKHQGILSPEILALSSKNRSPCFRRYLNDLLELNEEAFLNASDVQRGIDSVSHGYQNEIDESQLTFWIDPLDGSSGLAEGHTEHLTSIIGVSFNKRPLLGIVHKPFTAEIRENSTGSGIGRTYIGLAESGLFTIDNSNKTMVSLSHLVSKNESVPKYK